MKTRSTTPASCPSWRQGLLDALEGRLGPQLREALAEHLAHCEGCAAELESLRDTLGTLDAYRAPEPDEDYWHGLHARVRRALDEAPAPRRSLFAPRPAWGGVAALLLLVAALGWWMDRGPRPTDGATWLARMQAASRSELRADLLADAGTVNAVVDEEAAQAPDEDLMLEDLTAAELDELYARLEGLNG
ncbi:MAG: hypothetical protein R3C71_14380 [Candidatus Krumholzibacteriia bacterium]|nr:hypothetical protein [Candidatus Latescibacterota bacterium]MCB9516118.1 hypothetical protein [Candidatus Latescibacterota bacterium]